MINASYNQRKHTFITDLEILLLSNVKFCFKDIKLSILKSYTSLRETCTACQTISKINNPTMTNNDDHYTMAARWRYSTTTHLTIK